MIQGDLLLLSFRVAAMMNRIDNVCTAENPTPHAEDVMLLSLVVDAPGSQGLSISAPLDPTACGILAVDLCRELSPAQKAQVAKEILDAKVILAQPGDEQRTAAALELPRARP